MIALSSSRDGLPMAEGRYVAFVPCASVAPNGHYVEPIIAVWHGGKWHTEDKRSIVGYAGPIPIHKFDDFFPDRTAPKPAQEFDL